MQQHDASVEKKVRILSMFIVVSVRHRFIWTKEINEFSIHHENIINI